jgi:hypothetical protein
MCGTVGGTTGYHYVWGGFAPGELSTSQRPTTFVSGVLPSLGNWTAINYADFGP